MDMIPDESSKCTVVNHRLFIAISAAVFVASFARLHAVSIVLISLLVAHALSGLARRHSRFDSLLALLFGSLAFSFFIQLIGELIGPWATSGPATTLALIAVLWFGCERRSTMDETLTISLRRAALFALPVVALSFAVMSMSTANRVTVLGYGYDNAAHLEQGRIILHEGGSLLLSGGSQEAPSFVQDSAQVGGALIATVSRLTGLDAGSTSGLTAVLLVITILLPSILVLSAFALARDGGASGGISFVVVATVSVALFGTYLSRVWFSGYLASNLGTLGLALLVAYLARPVRRDPFIAMMLVIACGHTYTIFLFVATAIAIPVVFSDLWSLIGRPKQLRAKDLAFRFGLVSATGLTLVLPYVATKRSYAPSQFLVDGGIEELPAFSIVVLVAVASVPFLAQAYHALKPAFIVMCGLIVAVAIGVARYSLVEKGYISYYPTKVIIAMAVCLVFASVALFAAAARRRHEVPFALISLLAMVAVVIPQDAGSIFKTAYMGRMREVLPRLVDPVPLMVNGDIDVKLANLAEVSQTPVLLMSQKYRSELNSRWINVLAGTWNDKSWSGWMKLRTQLGEIASSQTSDFGLPIIVAADSDAVIGAAKAAGFEVCDIIEKPNVATVEC